MLILHMWQWRDGSRFLLVSLILKMKQEVHSLEVSSQLLILLKRNNT